MARLEVSFESASHSITPLPTSLADLQAKVKLLFNVKEFSVNCGPHELASTRDLLTAYLNNISEVLTLTVHEEVKPISYMEEAMSTLMSELVSAPPAEVDGVLPFNFISQLLDEADHVIKRISRGVANSFQDERMRYYKIDNSTYRGIVNEQLRTLALLQANTVGEVLRKHAVDPQLFNKSVDTHQVDLKQRLEQPDASPLSEVLPPGLDRAKFRTMLEYSTNFTLGYISERVALDQMEYALLKVLEADEMYQKFGYRESDINLAFKEFDFEGSAEWDDIKERLGQLKLAQI